MQFIYVVSMNSNCFKETALEDVITWNSGRRKKAQCQLYCTTSQKLIEQ